MGTWKQCFQLNRKNGEGEVMTGMENGEAIKKGVRLTIGLRLTLCFIALCIVLRTAGNYLGLTAGM
jgi:hypothetical protein